MHGRAVADQLSSDLASLRIDRAPARRSRLGAWLGWGLGLGAALFGAHALYGYAEAQLFRPEVKTTLITTLTSGQPSVELTATGTVIPQTVARVGTKRFGRVAKVRISEGQAVRVGEVLFELDPTDERMALGSATARINSARARAAAAWARLSETRIQLEREQQLVEGGAVARASIDDLAARLVALESEAKASEAEIKVALAEAGSLDQVLRQNVILAPINGTAVTRPAQIGDVVGPEMPLVELADFESLLVEVDVPESKLSRIRDGGPCEVVLDSDPERRLRGAVATISPRLDRAKATATVKVRITDQAPRIWPNMAARVSMLNAPLDEQQLAAPQRIIVPKSAVVERTGKRGVFVLDGELARFTAITTGEALSNSFVVLGGPAPGTRIVDRPPTALADGRAVKAEGS